MRNKLLTTLRQIDWRIFMGIILTLIWIAAGLIYLAGGQFSKTAIYDIPLENLGSFLEGAFAPLAFLWLVIGLFVQQKELADNTDVLRQTSIQSAKQTAAIAATEMNARQETFFKIADNVKIQMGSIGGMLFISCMGATEGQHYSKERLGEMWQMLAQGDDQVFSREFLLIDQEEFGGYATMFYKTEIRRRHSSNLIRTFDRLMDMARNCDHPNGIIADSLTQTAHGLLYTRMRQHLPEDLEVECPEIDSSDYEQVLAQTRI